MSQPTSVTVEGMQRAVNDLSNAQSTASSDRNRISGELDALGSAWTGEAAVKFREAGQAWLSHMDAILQGLQGLGNAMGQGGQQYQQTHEGTVTSAGRAGSTIAGAPAYRGLGI